MATLEDLSSLLHNLPSSSNIALSLQEVEICLTKVSPAKLAGLVPHLSFSNLFQYLDTDNKDQLACCCNILGKLLQPVVPSALISSFKNELVKGLQHHSPHVVDLCLTQLLRVMDDSPKHLVPHMDVVEALVGLLASDEPEIAAKASACLIKLGSDPEGVQVLFCNSLTTTFKNTLKTSDVVRYRIYEVLVKVIIESPDCLKYVSSHGDTNLLDMLISEVSPKNTDILTKLNVMEFASDLVSCQHGFQYLEDKGLIADMENSFEDAVNDPFLSNGYMKFFGCLCFKNPSLLNSRFKNFTNLLFSSILRRTPHILPIAIESLGLIGSTVYGKLALDQSGESMTHCMPLIGELIQQPPTELRSKTLDSLQQLLALPTELDGFPEAPVITEKWFGKLYDKDPVSRIISICQQPFLELKLSAFPIIKCLAMHPWGQYALKNSAGFQEYILDRAEQSKEGRKAKYEVVQTLVGSPTTQMIFGSDYYLKLRTFEKEGPFYVEAIPLVSFEDE